MQNPFRFTVFSSALILLALTAGSATALAGQESTTRGLNLGFHLQGATLKVGDGEADGGGGVGFRVGYGINRIVTLFFEADAVSVDATSADEFQGTWTLGHGDLGVRFHFANALRSWVPYLDVAIGARGASVKDIKSGQQELEDISFNGGAFTFGGGMYFYFKQTLAMEVGFKVSGGEFTELDLGSVSLENLNIDATSNRFKIGLVWWP